MFRSLTVCVVLFVAWNVASASDTKPSLPRALLLTGLGTSDPNHPKHILAHRFYNDRIVEILDDIVDVTVSDDLNVLSSDTLGSFDLVLNNSFLLEPSPAQFEAFFNFIEGGRGYIALHAGLESFVNSDRYVRMMGGRLAGHSPVKPFTVETFQDGFGRERTTPWAHPIVRGQPIFETRDELYVVQTNTDELEVIARAESHPIVWWRPWLNGSVLAFTLGHADFSLENPGYQALLRNSVRWMVGYPIIEPLSIGYFADDASSVEDVLDLGKRTHIRSNAAVVFTLENNRPDLVSASLDENDKVDLQFKSGATGKATIGVIAQTETGRSARTEFTVEVRKRGEGNLSAYHGVTAHSSSNEPRYSTADPALLNDRDPTTRWSSHYVDSAWIYLDLRDAYELERARLLWEGAHASEYQLEVSNDAQTWKTVAEVKGRGGVEEIRFRPTQARYIRMLANRRATRYGYSLYEFEVFGKPSSRR